MNNKDILEPISQPNDDGFVKQNDQQSVVSLKRLTIALLIGGAAVLGSYVVQPAEEQTQQETLEDGSTTLEQKIGENQIEILGVYDDEKDAVIETNVGFEDLRPELDLNLPFVDMNALIEDEKATEAVINDDLEEFRVKHG